MRSTTPIASPDVGWKGPDGNQQWTEPGAAPGVRKKWRVHTTPAPHTMYFAEFLRLAGGGAALQELVRHDALAMGRVPPPPATRERKAQCALLLDSG